MLYPARKLKVEEVLVNMSSITGGSVCIKFKPTDDMQAPYYFWLGEEKSLKVLEKRMNVESIYDLTGKTVIAFEHCTHIFEIVYDDGSEDAANKAIRRVTVTSVEDISDTNILKITAKADEETTIEYCFEKGLYAIKAFLLEMDVIDAKDLTGRSIIAYMDGDEVLRIARDFWR